MSETVGMENVAREFVGSAREISPQLQQIAEQHAATLGVSGHIHPDDYIFWHIHDDRALADKLEAPRRYLQSGRDTVALVASLLHEARVQQVLAQRPNPQQPLTLLDFASGYGRVTRHFPAVIPGLDVTGCDIHEQAVAFLETLGLKGSRSSTVPEDLSIGRSFDVIFSFSFFTHMPRSTWGRWLKAMARQLNPGGVLIFTAHGEVSQELMKVPALEADGFFFHPVSEQYDLDQAEYGNTVTAFDFVQHRIGESGLKLVQFREAGAGHHDVYVVRNASQEVNFHGAGLLSLQEQIHALRASTSWQVTRPLRALSQWVARR